MQQSSVYRRRVPPGIRGKKFASVIQKFAFVGRNLHSWEEICIRDLTVRNFWFVTLTLTLACRRNGGVRPGPSRAVSRAVSRWVNVLLQFNKQETHLQTEQYFARLISIHASAKVEN